MAPSRKGMRGHSQISLWISPMQFGVFEFSTARLFYIYRPDREGFLSKTGQFHVVNAFFQRKDLFLWKSKEEAVAFLHEYLKSLSDQEFADLMAKRMTAQESEFLKRYAVYSW